MVPGPGPASEDIFFLKKICIQNFSLGSYCTNDCVGTGSNVQAVFGLTFPFIEDLRIESFRSFATDPRGGCVRLGFIFVAQVMRC